MHVPDLYKHSESGVNDQYRCKCGKPMSHATGACPNCGSLGPHSFIGKNAAVNSTGGTGPARHGKNSYSEYAGRPHVAERPAEYPPAAHAEDNLPGDYSHIGPHVHEEADYRFPAGMRSHSPLLDLIRSLDDAQKSGGKTGKDSRRGYVEDDEREINVHPCDNDYVADEEKEKDREQPRREGNSSTLSTIISIVLVLAMVILIIYVINNYEELTRWLASPTVPEVLKPPVE